MRLIGKIMAALLLLSSLNLWASDAEDYKNQYNDEALRKLLENEEWVNASEQEDISFWLFWVLQQKEAPRKEIESSAQKAIAKLEDRISSGAESARSFYRLAILYNGLIFDAPTWMKYKSSEGKYLNLCLAIDPDYKDAKIHMVRRLLFLAPVLGGDETTGLSKLIDLNKEYPEDSDVLLIYAEYYSVKEEDDKSKEYYSRVLEQTSNHFRALKNYNELVLIEKNLPIGNIILKNQLRTRLGKRIDSVKKWEGKIYDQESKKEIQEIFNSLPSITGIQIQTMEMENRTVNLSLNVSENNLRVLGVLGGIGACSTYDNKPSVSGFPLLLYMDQNLFGTGNNLTVMFAGIFLGIDLINPERSILPFSSSFHADALYLPMEVKFIEDGKDTGWNLKTPAYNVSLELIKETPIGLVLSSFHNLKINNYEGGTSGFTIPENNITYTGNLGLKFSTIDSGFPSAFSPPVGFSFSVVPTIVFKPDYKAWGPNNDLFTHNDLPGGMFETSIKYYYSPIKRTHFGGSLTHYGSVNLYESEKWAIGQTDIISSGPRLSGYLSGEYRSKNAIVANLDGHFQILPDKILFLAKHDMYYDIDENVFRQGSALGVALKLPYEIELNIEAGAGWNAKRESGTGWSVQIALSRYFMY